MVGFETFTVIRIIKQVKGSIHRELERS